MARRSRTTRRALVVLTMALLGATTIAGVAYAGHAGTDVTSYTGCLSTQGGTLTLIAEGNAPQRTCPAGSTEAHFSGGDITAVDVGFGLTGGGDNGAVTIALDSKYALRQDCTTGQVLQWTGSAWACADPTTYTAGTGLVLDGSEFSLDPTYQLPQDCALGSAVTWTRTEFSLGEWGCADFAYASQDCASGKFANGIDEDGKLKCATPGSSGGSGGTAYTAQEVNPHEGNAPDDHVGIPDDGNYYTYVSLTVPGGTYAVTASGAVQSEHDVCSGIGACFFEANTPTCKLVGGTDSVEWSEDQFNDPAFNGAFNLVDAITTAGGTLNLQCVAQVREDGLSLHDARIMAIKIG